MDTRRDECLSSSHVQIHNNSFVSELSELYTKSHIEVEVTASL